MNGISVQKFRGGKKRGKAFEYYFKIYRGKKMIQMLAVDDLGCVWRRSIHGDWIIGYNGWDKAVRKIYKTLEKYYLERMGYCGA